MNSKDIDWNDLRNRADRIFGRRHRFVISKIVKHELGSDAFYLKDYKLDPFSLMSAYRNFLEELENHEEQERLGLTKSIATACIKQQPFY